MYINLKRAKLDDLETNIKLFHIMFYQLIILTIDIFIQY